MANYFRNRRQEQQQRHKNTRIFGIVAAIFLLAAFAVTELKNGGRVGESTDTAVSVSIVTETHGPESGTVFFRKYEGNPARLHITNNSTSDVFAKCSDGLFNSAVISFFLRAGEEISLDVPVGYFELHAAVGTDWVSEEALFGDDTVYLRDSLANGLEFGRKKTCEFSIEPDFSNMKLLNKNDF